MKLVSYPMLVQHPGNEICESIEDFFLGGGGTQAIGLDWVCDNGWGGGGGGGGGGGDE